jgi:hypothetical protein
MKYTNRRKHLGYYFYFVLGLLGILIAALANSPAPTRAALTPPEPFYDGMHEIADCTQIAGWAMDHNAPDVSIYVDIYDGPIFIGSAPADRFRRELSNAGVYPYHGFRFLTPSSVKDGKIHQISVKYGGTSINLPGSPRFIACNVSLFPTASSSGTFSTGGTREHGVEFSSSMNGIIQKVRFWRGDEEPMGNHTARIWTAAGTLLKTAPFAETSNVGWQYATVNFPISAGVRYKVSFNVNYAAAKIDNVFQNGPIIQGPLTAWGASYSQGAGNFPATSTTSNLFADVVFNAPR